MDIARTTASIIRRVDAPLIDDALEAMATDVHAAEAIRSIGQRVVDILDAPARASNARIAYANLVASSRNRAADPAVLRGLYEEIVSAVSSVPRELDLAASQAAESAAMLASPQLQELSDLVRGFARPTERASHARSMANVALGEGSAADEELVRRTAWDIASSSEDLRRQMPWWELSTSPPVEHAHLMPMAATAELQRLTASLRSSGAFLGERFDAAAASLRVRSGTTLATATHATDLGLLRDAQVGATSRIQLLEDLARRAGRIGEDVAGTRRAHWYSRTPRDAAALAESARIQARELAELGGALRSTLSSPVLPADSTFEVGTHIRSRASGRLGDAVGRLVAHLDAEGTARDPAVWRERLAALSRDVEHAGAQLVRVEEGEQLFARMQDAAMRYARSLHTGLEGADRAAYLRSFAARERAAADAADRIATRVSEDLVSDWASVVGGIVGHAEAPPAALPTHASLLAQLRYRSFPNHEHGAKPVFGPLENVDPRIGIMQALERAGVEGVRSTHDLPAYLRTTGFMPDESGIGRVSAKLRDLADYHEAMVTMHPDDAYRRTMIRREP